MEQQSYKFILFKKLLIFGAEGVGKTTLIYILEHNNFPEEESDIESK